MLRNRPRLAGALVGLLVAALGTLCFSAITLFQQMELFTFDLRVRHCNNLRPDPSILHIDVDDGSLERIGRWPWPRDRLGDIIRTTRELGAADIFVDFLLTEPQPPYLENPAYGPYRESGSQFDLLGELARSNEIFPDLQMADDLRRAGHVVLAAHLKLVPPGAAESAPSAEDRLREAAVKQLRTDFSVDETGLAKALNTSPQHIASIFARAKADAARQLVDRLFTSGGRPSQASAIQQILGPRAELHTADRADIEKAWCWARSLAALRKSAYRAEVSTAGLYRAENAEPPEYHLAEAAAGLAGVNFASDIDYAVRRVPLVIDFEGRLLNHLGFAAACRACDLRPAAMTRDARGALLIPTRDAARVYRVPLDEQGEMLIPWTVTGPAWREGRDIRHLPASAVWALIDARRQIQSNRVAINYLLADIIAVVKGSVVIDRPSDQGGPTTMPGDTRYRERVNEQLAAEEKLRRQRLFGDLPASEADRLRARAADLLREIETEQRAAVSAVKVFCRDLDTLSPEEIAADPALAAKAKIYRAALDRINGEFARLQDANRQHEATITRWTKDLSEALKDKHVFLGFAATAEGDIVPTPIDKRTNGVMCHAYVLNSFLQNRFLARAPHSIEITVCLLLGAAVSLLTATRPPRVALVATLLLIVSYAAAASYILFMRFDIWIALVAPCGVTFVTWAFVTLFRQLTAERDRRMFARQLSQYTSPAIAARIAESPEAAAAFKTVQLRDMTCYFSDLAGFTSLSEKQSPQIIQHVLNTYLERMSQVIWARRGLINKFMGDGVMAIFNPSVDPMTEHPREACETALATLEHLEQLKRERAADPAADIYQRLHMRIGLATGQVMNGDLGSELKADYTVIGDVVNLAARLEPANKVFGTQLMVSGPLHALVRDLYDFRYLAELRVSGKTATVPVYELIGRRGTLDADARSYVERFEAGVQLYKSRKWDECIVHFTRMLSRRFDDPGASRYIDACQEFKQFPPDEDWPGALELKEK